MLNGTDRGKEKEGSERTNAIFCEDRYAAPVLETIDAFMEFTGE